MRAWLAAAAAVAALAAGACSNSSQKTSAPPGPAATVGVAPVPASSPPPGTPAASPPPLPTATPAGAAGTDLTFTGSLASHVQSATSTGPCGRAPAGFAAALQFPLSGQSYVLSIAILDYRGPGQYTIPPERVSVRSGQGAGEQLLPAVGGSLVVDASERSGRIAATLGDGSTQVRGTWACT